MSLFVCCQNVLLWITVNKMKRPPRIHPQMLPTVMKTLHLTRKQRLNKRADMPPSHKPLKMKMY